MSLLHIAASALGAELHHRKYAETVKEVDVGFFEALRPFGEDEIQQLFSTANHGLDNRSDLFDPDVSDVQRANALAVGMIVHKSAVLRTATGWRLKAPFNFEYFRGDAPVCPDEKYLKQPSVRDKYAKPGWTCCLIHPKAVLTCAHGLPVKRLQEYRVVFGYHAKEKDAEWLDIAHGDVIELDRVFRLYHYKQDKLTLGPDWALLVMKEASKRPPVMLIKGPPPEAVKPGKVYALGHPHGLPMKVCHDAYVRETCVPGVFAAPLDTDEGNSGSPVFIDEYLIGIVIKRQLGGPPDYAVPENGSEKPCYARQKYATSGGAITCTHADGSKHVTYVVGQLCTSSTSFEQAIADLRAASL